MSHPSQTLDNGFFWPEHLVPPPSLSTLTLRNGLEGHRAPAQATPRPDILNVPPCWRSQKVGGEARGIST